MTSPLTKLRALAEKATPGKVYVGAQNDAIYLVSGKPPAEGNDFPDHGAGRAVIAKMYRWENADLYAALRNAAPAIMDALEAAERFRPAVDEYIGRHISSVARDLLDVRDDYDAAMERVREVLG